MADAWTWDETLYAGSAAHYVAGRMPYPQALGDAIAGGLGLDGRERLLDVGCGPGPLTLLLAPRVATAIGIDADPGMIAEATRAAQRRGVGNVVWRTLRAESLPADIGTVDVVTFAQSLHWMERERVASAVLGMLSPGGACVHVGATTHRGDESTDPLPLPRPPHDAIDALVRSELGPVRRAGRSSRATTHPPGSEPGVFAAAGFTDPQRIEVPRGEIVTRTVDEVVAATFSLSSSTPHLLRNRRAHFERALRALLHDASADGRFAERARGITVDIYRPGR